VITLGLAIGATTAIFSVIEPVLLRPLPYPRPERLAFVWERGRDGSRDNVGYATFRDFMSESKTIEYAAAIGDWQPTAVRQGQSRARLRRSRVLAVFPQRSGCDPEIGATSSSTTTSLEKTRFVILSHCSVEATLQRRPIDRRPSDIDRRHPMTVVGVMPESFDNCRITWHADLARCSATRISRGRAARVII
jgi:hypothetical protein